ncbi:hypothetical protein TorRG33x02_018810, partial [Trema orientale]
YHSHCRSTLARPVSIARSLTLTLAISPSHAPAASRSTLGALGTLIEETE